MLGGTFGAAALGAVLNGALSRRFGGAGGAADIEAVRHMFDAGASAALAPGDRAALMHALASGMTEVFAALAIFAALTLMATWMVPRREAFAESPVESKVN
jgi:hypothetical protein